MSELRVFAFGGGVQSTAALALAAAGTVDYQRFLFCNVGDDSEHPATLDYVHDVSMPYAAEHGLEVAELRKLNRKGEPSPSLFAKLTAPGSRSLPIPVRMSRTGAPGTRSCTAEYKIRVIDRWLREHGATEADPATVGLGISVDEIQRAKPGRDPLAPRQIRHYPLLDLGLDRAACVAAILRAGLPVPPKSACWFCPYHRKSEWRRMKRDEPALFARSVALERTMNERRTTLGKDPVWFTDALVPLDEAISPDGDQLTLEFAEGSDCESGHCGL